MQSMQGITFEIPDQIRQRAYAELQDAWNDPDVKEFLRKHQDVIDDHVKNVANSVILNYVQSKKEGRYEQELVMYAGHITVMERPTHTERTQMLQDNIRKQSKYDAITRSYGSVEYRDGDIGGFKAEQFASNFLENYKYGAKQKGMWLHGDRGVGKTFFMGYFTQLLQMQNIAFTFINSAQFYQDMLDVQRNYSKDISKKLWDIKASQILIIDDMGAEKASDFMINDVLFNIMDYRMSRNLPTFCTSNYTKQDYLNYITRIGLVMDMEAKRYVERLDTLMTEVHMKGTNKRNKE